MAHDIDVTVAAIIERDGRFLLVEEKCAGRLVLNQPAGHLEHGESLLAAVAREAFEETGHQFTPAAIVGFYLWRADSGTTFLRVAFCGTAEPPLGPATLDEGIVGVHWLSREQLLKRSAQLRSPTVLRCFDDYLACHRHPLDCLVYLRPDALAPSQTAHG
ncbi:MAG: NUDIX hydrolase [Gammaproteobacteria bacterium]